MMALLVMFTGAAAIGAGLLALYWIGRTVMPLMFPCEPDGDDIRVPAILVGILTVMVAAVVLGFTYLIGCLVTGRQP